MDGMVSQVCKSTGSQETDRTKLTDSRKIKENRQRIYLRNVIVLSVLHACAFNALAKFPPPLYTFLFNFVLYAWACFSITAGLHRLWSHKSYKAKWPLRLFFAVGQGFAYNFSIYKWVWVHRLHHKYTDTDADPHNSKRGFFYSHIGWLMQLHHEEVFLKKKTIDLRDLEEDWIIMWQYKLFPVVGPVSCFVLPTLIPHFFWDEELWTAWSCCALRWITTAHVTFIVNSVAHLWGSKPYNSNISSSNNLLVSIFAYGEGSHNYHHVFPWDYKTAESKSYFCNATLLFLHLCSKLGLAYDFKEASPEMIQKRKLRTGHRPTQSKICLVWGLEDEDMDEQEKNMPKCIESTEINKSFI